MSFYHRRIIFRVESLCEISKNISSSFRPTGFLLFSNKVQKYDVAPAVPLCFLGYLLSWKCYLLFIRVTLGIVKVVFQLITLRHLPNWSHRRDSVTSCQSDEVEYQDPWSMYSFMLSIVRCIVCVWIYIVVVNQDPTLLTPFCRQVDKA